MKEWFAQPKSDRELIIKQVSAKTGLPPAAIEKDLWVICCLEAIFATDCGKYLVFKGGTSLSKSWQTIDRFSEDIDLAIDKSYFGYGNEIS